MAYHFDVPREVSSIRISANYANCQVVAYTTELNVQGLSLSHHTPEYSVSFEHNCYMIMAEGTFSF